MKNRGTTTQYSKSEYEMEKQDMYGLGESVKIESRKTFGKVYWPPNGRSRVENFVSVFCLTVYQQHQHNHHQLHHHRHRHRHCHRQRNNINKSFCSDCSFSSTLAAIIATKRHFSWFSKDKLYIHIHRYTYIYTYNIHTLSIKIIEAQF